VVSSSSVDQRIAPGTVEIDGTMWLSLGMISPASGTVTVELTDAADGVVVADAVRVVDAYPEIESLTSDRASVFRGEPLRLTANGVIDADGNETIQKVEFFYDSNGSGSYRVGCRYVTCHRHGGRRRLECGNRYQRSGSGNRNLLRGGDR
jgi:hypothetical protein